MSISNYAELKVLDHLTGRASWTAPTSVYIKLHTASPGEDCTSNPATNTTRKVTAWNAAASGAISISSTLSWTSVPASETYTHWSAWDALTDGTGNPLWYGALSSSAAVTTGDTFEITSLTLSLD